MWCNFQISSLYKTRCERVEGFRRASHICSYRTEHIHKGIKRMQAIVSYTVHICMEKTTVAWDTYVLWLSLVP